MFQKTEQFPVASCDFGSHIVLFCSTSRQGNQNPTSLDLCLLLQPLEVMVPVTYDKIMMRVLTVLFTYQCVQMSTLTITVKIPYLTVETNTKKTRSCA